MKLRAIPRLHYEPGKMPRLRGQPRSFSAWWVMTIRLPEVFG